MKLSLVVPAYDESARISDSLRAMGSYLADQPYDAEIVVVDDGSRDGTAGVVREIASGVSVPLRVLRYARNRGKGAALKVGFAAAIGDVILFSDADLSTPIEEIAPLLARIEDGADLVIGSRHMRGSAVEQRQPWYRTAMGSVFTLIVRATIADVSDATCGFKAYRAEVGRDLFSRLRVYDWSFDAELLYLARRAGYRLDEVPVRWADRAGTRVRLLRDSASSLVGIARILVNGALGRYDRPAELDVSPETWSLEVDGARGIDSVA